MFSRSDELRYSANVLPNTQVVAAFRVGGYVERVEKVEEGDRVARGAVLAVLRQGEYLSKVGQVKAQMEEATAALQAARSQLVEAETALRQAELDFKRAQNLFNTQSLTKADYDGARTKLDIAQAKVETARDQVKAIESRGAGARELAGEAGIALDDTSLKAPIEGVALKRMVEPGALVAPGTPAFVLADLASVKIVFGVSDVAISSLRPGAVLPVHTEALPGAVLRGRITRIAPSADLKSRLFDVELTIDNREGRLRPGMIASVVLAGAAAKPVPVIPLGAIVRSKTRPDGYSVFVAGEDSVARLRDVELGEAFGNNIAVTAGVRTGERVITSGSNLVHDGERVLIVP